MPIKIAINGFGRIGRPVFRRIIDNHPELRVVAINDLTNSETLAHLLQFDSSYGMYKRTVEHADDAIIVDGKEYRCTAEKDPTKLPWKSLRVDVVLECTGFFRDFEGAQKHLQAGAKKVIISAPCKSLEIAHYLLGVNQDKYDPKKDDVISMASCTTNCLAPVAKVLHENFEIESGLATTIHSYTNDQRLLDSPHKKDLRRARSAALSMIPTTTGAAIAVTKVLPELGGKLNGVAIRVPTPVVSIVDFVARVKKATTADKVNKAFQEAAKKEEFKSILSVEKRPLVSMDYKGCSFSSVIDIPSTMVQDGKLVKVLAWYDNEWGYASRLAELAEFIGEKL